MTESRSGEESAFGFRGAFKLCMHHKVLVGEYSLAGICSGLFLIYASLVMAAVCFEFPDCVRVGLRVSVVEGEGCGFRGSSVFFMKGWVCSAQLRALFLQKCLSTFCYIGAWGNLSYRIRVNSSGPILESFAPVKAYI